MNVTISRFLDFLEYKDKALYVVNEKAFWKFCYESRDYDEFSFAVCMQLNIDANVWSKWAGMKCNTQLKVILE